jgi:hypothetical protein
MAQASHVRGESRVGTPMAPVIGADAEAAVQSAQVLHPTHSRPKVEEASFAKSKGMRWYVYLLAAAAVVIGIGLLIGVWD